MSSVAKTQSVVIRDIETIAEMRSIEDLQIEVWGDAERDIVPISQFVAARYVGGSLIGAFDESKLVGFVYGFLGHRQGHLVHHSHMLAVSPAYRSHNLAFRLKLAQRDRVISDKITDRITWTFDPLQSLNAHFNFAKLGVVSDVYKVNVYGDAGQSFLHRNGTDRFFVTWLVESQRVKRRISGAPSPGPGPDHLPANSLCRLANSGSGVPISVGDAEDLSALDAVLIEIPTNINSIESANFDLARDWRERSREVFSQALSAGFVVTEYFLKSEQTGCYLLQRMGVADLN